MWLSSSHYNNLLDLETFWHILYVSKKVSSEIAQCWQFHCARILIGNIHGCENLKVEICLTQLESTICLVSSCNGLNKGRLETNLFKPKNQLFARLSLRNPRVVLLSDRSKVCYGLTVYYCRRSTNQKARVTWHTMLWLTDCWKW